MPKKITIAIDGFSGCGKSTTAKGVAKKLSYTYIDTGAMYRAVTLDFIRNGVDPQDQESVKKALENIDIEFRYHPEKQAEYIYLNGEEVEKQIRGMDVSNLVSLVSSIRPVRQKLVEMQRQLGKSGGIVMDGRDIGTNVFPDAELKYFVTADSDVRVERRFEELKSKGISVDRKEIKLNLEQRDEMDQNRAENPLVKAKDALTLDTSDKSIDEQIDIVVNKAQEIIDKHA
jgi:cytidylate kinase